MINFWRSLFFGLVLLTLLPGCSPNRDLVAPSDPSAPSPRLEPANEKNKGPEKRAPRDLIVLLPEADGKVGKIRVTTEGKSQVIERPWVGVQAGDSGRAVLIPQTVPESEVQDVFSGALEVHPDLPNRFISVLLWFESDQTKLTTESKKTLKEIVKTIKQRKAKEIYITGHTDRVGSEGHNRKLSSKRAFYVRDFLVANGIQSKTLILSFHGENMPLVDTEDEMPEPSNRRVEVFIK